MLQLKPLRSIFMCFAVFGQSRYDWIFTSKSRLIFNVIIILKAVYLILVANSVVFACVQIRIYKSFDMVHSLSFLILITNFIGTIEGWIYDNTLQSIVMDFDKLIGYLEACVNVNIRLMDFVRRFYKKLIFSAVIFSIEWITKLSLPSMTFFRSYADYVILIASLYKYIAILHAATFIDLHVFILMTLNGKLNPIARESAKLCLIYPIPVDNVLEVLPQIKVVYQKIWIISEKINKRFGYFLLASFVDTALLAIHVAMGMAMYLVPISASRKVLVLRK